MEQRPDKPEPEPVEQDGRFPSGPWTGFYVYGHGLPGKHGMDLTLTFRDGVMQGDGHDGVGRFLIKGRYQVEDGRCWWTKRYVGRHDVAYQGYNEGKGIWGVWDIRPILRGGFHIWPVGMGDMSKQRLAEELDVPSGAFEAEPVAVTSGDDDRFGSLES